MFLFTLSTPLQSFAPIPDLEAPRAQTGPCSLCTAKPGLLAAGCQGAWLSHTHRRREVKGLHPDVVEVDLFKFRVIVLYPLQCFLYIC